MDRHPCCVWFLDGSSGSGCCLAIRKLPSIFRRQHLRIAAHSVCQPIGIAELGEHDLFHLGADGREPIVMVLVEFRAPVDRANIGSSLRTELSTDTWKS